MRDWAHSRRLGTPAGEAGSVVLRQPPASKLANLFRIDVRASPFGRRPQPPMSCDLLLNHAAFFMQNEPIYERPVVKRGGADFVSQGSRTSPSPSASVDLAHLRPVRRRFSVHPATHPLSPRPRESFLPQCRQCTKR